MTHIVRRVIYSISGALRCTWRRSFSILHFSMMLQVHDFVHKFFDQSDDVPTQYRRDFHRCATVLTQCVTFIIWVCPALVVPMQPSTGQSAVVIAMSTCTCIGPDQRMDIRSFWNRHVTFVSVFRRWEGLSQKKRRGQERSDCYFRPRCPPERQPLTQDTTSLRLLGECPKQCSATGSR